MGFEPAAKNSAKNEECRETGKKLSLKIKTPKLNSTK